MFCRQAHIARCLCEASEGSVGVGPTTGKRSRPAQSSLSTRGSIEALVDRRAGERLCEIGQREAKREINLFSM